MKRLITFLSIILLLTGCNSAAPSESISIESIESESIESEESIESIESIESSESIESETPSEESDESIESIESETPSEESETPIESEESSEESEEPIESIESIDEMVTISFYNYDDSLLYTYDTYKGDYPYYPYDDPTREDVDLYEYEFIGWDKPLSCVYEDTDYVALYEEVEKYFTITDILENSETYLNKQVILRDVGISATYTSNTFVVASTNNPLDFYSIIVKTDIDVSSTFNRGDIVDVLGVIEKDNGRTIINHAEVNWGYGGQSYCDDAANIGVTQLKNREEWIDEINYLYSSSNFYTDLVFASLPVIEANKDLYFHVVFPGEDITIKDDNFYLIDAFIPALDESQVETVKTWLSSFEVGSGLYGLFQPYYDNNEMKIIFPYDFITSKNFNKLIEFDNITTDYSIIDSFIKNCYDEDKVIFPSFVHESIYNYKYYEKLEKVNSSSYRTVMTIEMYTYNTNDIISYLDEAFINSDIFTYLGIDNDNKHQVKTTYSSDSEMFISYYEGFGKVIFKSYLD